jgi:hypothetical protein
VSGVKSLLILNPIPSGHDMLSHNLELHALDFYSVRATPLITRNVCKTTLEVLAGTGAECRRPNKTYTQKVYECITNRDNQKPTPKVLSKAEKAAILSNLATKFATVSIEPIEKVPPRSNVCRYKVGFMESEEKPLQVVVGVLPEDCDECRGVRAGGMREVVDEVHDLGWEKRGNL